MNSEQQSDSKEPRLFASTTTSKPITQPPSEVAADRRQEEEHLSENLGGSDGSEGEDEEFVAATPPLAKRFKTMSGFHHVRNQVH